MVPSLFGQNTPEQALPVDGHVTSYFLSSDWQNYELASRIPDSKPGLLSGLICSSDLSVHHPFHMLKVHSVQPLVSLQVAAHSLAEPTYRLCPNGIPFIPGEVDVV